ncbi:Rho GTPase-activating 36 [Gossypium arboreum]|uniref:Rho GTPase-activating 36 n=1 Tax=Gossypium arboreum TaxID=29729 RepID=A0A0B0MKT4_GOSAR|nr:Rho GTPase-activating 36 [Gossypium arboreum]
MTRSKPCHTGSSHAPWQSRHTAVSHGRVLAEPKLSPIQKRPLLRVSRHSKAYKYTLEEEKKGDREGR